jgi:tetratricopeptide (TPR) repeat protein
LADAKAAMCAAHLREAESVINRRLARANASNPDGWAAITTASLALDQPHLPNGLAGRLPSAVSSIYSIPEPGELAQRAAAVVEAAGWFRDRPDDFAAALGQEPALAGQWPDWLANLILDLGAAGLGSSAERVGDALAKVDPGRQALVDADVSVALAESGLADKARDQIAANLARWPHDLWVRVHAGDALAALGDPEGAREHFDAALRMAEESDDFETTAEVIDRLRTATRRSASEHSGRGGQREQPRRKLSKAQRQRQNRRKPR